MRHVISILMANESGALVRVAGMFSQRGFNIETLNVAPVETQTVSRLTLVTRGTQHVVDQIVRQLLKLVDVIDVQNMTAVAHAELEVALIKIRPTADASVVEAATAELDVKTIDATNDARMLRFLGNGNDLNRLIEALSDAEALHEQVRSGAVTLVRGQDVLHDAANATIPESIIYEPPQSTQ